MKHGRYHRRGTKQHILRLGAPSWRSLAPSDPALRFPPPSSALCPPISDLHHPIGRECKLPGTLSYWLRCCTSQDGPKKVPGRSQEGARIRLASPNGRRTFRVCRENPTVPARIISFAVSLSQIASLQFQSIRPFATPDSHGKAHPQFCSEATAGNHRRFDHQTHAARPRALPAARYEPRALEPSATGAPAKDAGRCRPLPRSDGRSGSSRQVRGASAQTQGPRFIAGDGGIPEGSRRRRFCAGSLMPACILPGFLAVKELLARQGAASDRIEPAY